MKVLFALSDEDVSEQIVKRYRKEYKEIITFKNVYYFNAIAKEIQKDKSYDRIVISEDLEQYVTNNINQIDKTIFEKLDAITDEATDGKGKEIPIIFICGNNRKKSDYFAVKLFSLGIYNALMGNDREVSEVCQLLKRPRSKKDAKLYYKIDSEEVSYQSESENDVNEVEIKNILAHYKKIGNDEKKCIASFDNIASQYNEQQLKLIIKCLPLSVRAILEEKSDKYRQIVLASPSLKLSNSEVMREKEKNKSKNSQNLQSLLGGTEQGIKKEVIIQTNINLRNVKKIDEIKQENENLKLIEDEEQIIDLTSEGQQELQEEQVEIIDLTSEEPKKLQEEQNEIIDLTAQNIEEETNAETVVDLTSEEIVQPKESKKDKKKSGIFKRFKRDKNKEEAKETISNLIEQNKKEEPEVELEEVIDLTSEEEIQEEPETEFKEVEETKIKLQSDEHISRYSNSESKTQPKFDEKFILEENEILDSEEVEDFVQESEEKTEEIQEEEISEVLNNDIEEKPTETELKDISEDVNNLFTDAEIYASDKKIVAFVGAHQAGTSFLINSLAELLQSKGVNTAILDLTKNRNSYYIYTKNDEDLRNIAMNTTDNLLNDRNSGIKVRRNLFVYTSLPEDEINKDDIKMMLKKLISKHYLILIDCDLDTPINCFGYANEVYLVQNKDILTVQPLTQFLNKLKKSNILDVKKFKAVINKSIYVRGVDHKTIISGMSYYSDSKMSETKELFNRNEIDRVIIPFDEKTYSKYLESMADCDINITGYSKKFMKSLKELALKICPNIKIK